MRLLLKSFYCRRFSTPMSRINACQETTLLETGAKYSISKVRYLTVLCYVREHLTKTCVPCSKTCISTKLESMSYWVLYLNDWLMFHFSVLSLSLSRFLHSYRLDFKCCWWLNIKEVTTTCDLFRLNSLKFRNQNAIAFFLHLWAVNQQQNAKTMMHLDGYYIFKFGGSKWEPCNVLGNL